VYSDSNVKYAAAYFKARALDLMPPNARHDQFTLRVPAVSRCPERCPIGGMGLWSGGKGPFCRARGQTGVVGVAATGTLFSFGKFRMSESAGFY
jgi:hypothetical protein